MLDSILSRFGLVRYSKYESLYKEVSGLKDEVAAYDVRMQNDQWRIKHLALSRIDPSNEAFVEEIRRQEREEMGVRLVPAPNNTTQSFGFKG